MFGLSQFRLAITMIGASSILLLACHKPADPGTGSPGLLDPAVVGIWHYSDVNTSEFVTGGVSFTPSGTLLDYTFRNDGTYTLDYYTQSAAGCLITVFGEKQGVWSVDDAKQTITLQESAYVLKTTDACNSFNNTEKHPALHNHVYPYHIAVDPADGHLKIYFKLSSGGYDVFYQ